MEVLYLAIIFAVIVVIVWMKKPLYLAMVAGIVASILLFRINPLEALTVLAKQTASWETIDLLLSFYVIIFLQLMLEKKGRLANAKDAFNRLFRNRRINTMIPPAIMGLLPSAAVMTVCADMVDQTCGDYLDAKSKTFVSCYYRHIPEMFLPTFPVILLAMSLSGQNVGTFILTMIPLVILACLVVNFTYLRKIPKAMPPLDDTVDKRQEVLRLLRNLWTLILVLVIIVAGNLSASFAGPIVIAINYFVDHFKAKDLPEMLVKSAEPVLLGNMYLIMLFKSLLSHTGGVGEAAGIFQSVPHFYDTVIFPAVLLRHGNQRLSGHCGAVYANGDGSVPGCGNAVAGDADGGRVGGHGDFPHPCVRICGGGLLSHHFCGHLCEGAALRADFFRNLLRIRRIVDACFLSLCGFSQK